MGRLGGRRFFRADGKVWLSDWGPLRQRFANRDYTVAEGAATVPEPSTLAMLPGCLAGFVVYAWRRRRRLAAPLPGQTNRRFSPWTGWICWNPLLGAKRGLTFL